MVATESTMNPMPQIRDGAVSWFTARRSVEVVIMLIAAICEVGGDAMIRAGLRKYGWLFCGLGVVTLGAYGIVVNLLAIDFSKLLATYVAFFAIVSIVFGRSLFAEKIAVSTWAGLGVILLGSAIIQFGSGGQGQSRPSRRDVARRALRYADDDVGRLHDRRRSATDREPEIVDRFVGDRRGDDEAVRDLDLDVRGRRALGDGDHFARHYVAS